MGKFIFPFAANDKLKWRSHYLKSGS